MISSNKLIVQKIVSACESYGIKHVVVCPGSRNAPFSIAFDNHPAFTTYVIHDERSAAFFALGMIDQLQIPVALVCTSGSAIQNFSPAVSEAFYRQLPLVVKPCFILLVLGKAQFICMLAYMNHYTMFKK